MYILANFAAYGLNKYKNFLPYVDNTEVDVLDLTELRDNTVSIYDDMLDDVMAESLLSEADPYSAIFTINISGHHSAYIHKADSEIEVIECQLKESDEMFALIDADYNLTSYALLIEIAPNLWKVVCE